jgi:capsid protein
VRKAGTDGRSDSDFEFLPRYDKNGRFFCMLVRAPGSKFPGQVRSFPMLAGSMDVIDVLDQRVDSAAIEAETKSSMSVMIESEVAPELGKDTFKDDAEKSPELLKLNLSDIKSGEVIVLPPGTKPHIINNAGNLDLVEQIKQQLKLVAAGIGIPYAALMSDFEKINFSSSKMLMNKLYKLIDLWNFGPIARLFNELFKWVCYEHYLIKGVLPAKEMLTCNWIGPSIPDIDPVKSANAEKTRLAAGTITRSDIVGARTGDDYKTHLCQLKKEEDLETEILGAPLGRNFSSSSSSNSDEDNSDENGTGDEE